MKLTGLNLQYFKNYEEQQLVFSDKLNCIVGLNGSGKTNLLDSLHYLAFTKSAFNTTDNQNIKKGAKYFLVKGEFGQDQILCYQERNQKKILKRNGAEYEKLSDHIGKILVILHTPYDTEIIRDSSEYRRKWVDGCISQHDHEYLNTLLKFQKIVRQRNAFLKQIDGHLNPTNASLLETYDDQIIPFSVELAKKREKFIQEIQPFFHENIKAIVSDREFSTISYKSQLLEEHFRQSYLSNRNKDVMMQRTTMGAHRDDYVFNMDDMPIRKYGSQGQQKSFLIALRLTQYDYLFDKLGEKPILLLDDVFDKLDDERISRLIHILDNNDRFGQVFITDARKERSLSLFENVENKKIFEISEGKAVEI